jgi:hypothetical protein
MKMAGLNRSQAFASHPAAIGQNGAPALAGISTQESVLSFATNFRWLILALHTSSAIQFTGLKSLFPDEEDWSRRTPLGHGRAEHNNEEKGVKPASLGALARKARISFFERSKSGDQSLLSQDSREIASAA